MEQKIRSRRPIRLEETDNYNPAPGSPFRRNRRNLSPHLSGSDDDDDVDQELMQLEAHPDTNSSLNTTLNSSSDVADCGAAKFIRSQTEQNVKFYANGQVREMNFRKVNEKVIIPQKVRESHGTANHVFIAVAAVLLIVGGAATFYSKQVQTVNRPQQICSFEQSQRNFPNQDKMLWKSLKLSVESVLNEIPTKPSVFLLAYEDRNSADKITRSIVERTAECMDSKVNPVVLSADDLAYSEMKTDYGVVITKYENQLKRSGVMLVHDLNKVPSKVAPAFHVFCDVHNPLVDRSIIFLTMQLVGNSHSSSHNSLQLVENYLRSNWSEVDSFILDPLIVRVTDQVFVLNKE